MKKITLVVVAAFLSLGLAYAGSNSCMLTSSKGRMSTKKSAHVKTMYAKKNCTASKAKTACGAKTVHWNQGKKDWPCSRACLCAKGKTCACKCKTCVCKSGCQKVCKSKCKTSCECGSQCGTKACENQSDE